jgi:DNA-binding transcriptional ArsR family regulator
VDLTSITPSPEQLKALTHPVRVRMLGLLRIDGPATATSLAARLGLNSGATSYHLRQLAQHGFITDDEARGNGRERWWRAAHQSTTTERETAYDEEGRETLDTYLQSVAVVLTEVLQRAVEKRPLLSEEWRSASEFSDYVVRLTPASAKRLMDSLGEILQAQEKETGEGAEDFVVQLTAFPYPGRVGGEPS